MTLVNLILAFSGGIFGALIGGTTAFIFTGIFALLGAVLLLATGNSFLLDNVAFGAFFGPHIAFVGGVAAAALSGVKKKQLGDHTYINGSDAMTPLLITEDSLVLLVGGIFGAGGFVVNELLISTGIEIDTVATSVAILGLLSRVLISRTHVIGNYTNDKIKTNKLLFTLLWGGAISLLTSQTVLMILADFGESIPTFGWAISTVSLIFLYTNLSSFPISHHITINAAYFALATGSIWVGAIAGMISGVLGLYVARYTNTNVESHLDMPAIIIAIGSFIAFNFF